MSLLQDAEQKAAAAARKAEETKVIVTSVAKRVVMAMHKPKQKKDDLHE